MELQKIVQSIVSLAEKALLQHSKNQVIQDIKQKKARAADAFKKLDDFALFRATLSMNKNKCFLWAVQQLNGEYKDLTNTNDRALHLSNSNQECKLNNIQYGWDIHIYSVYTVTLRQSYKRQIYRNYFQSYERFLQNFGIPIDQIKNRAQLLMFLQIILDSLQIEIPDDDDIKSNKNGANDQSLYQISSRFFESFGYKRILKPQKIRDPYAHPITLQLVGIKRVRLIGVKVTMYDPLTLEQKGVFLNIDPKKWEFDQKEKASVKKQKYNRKDPLVDMTHIANALKDYGFKIIYKDLLLQKNKMSQWEINLQTPLGCSKIDVLERFFDKERYHMEMESDF